MGYFKVIRLVTDIDIEWTVHLLSYITDSSQKCYGGTHEAYKEDDDNILSAYLKISFLARLHLYDVE